MSHPGNANVEQRTDFAIRLRTFVIAGTRAALNLSAMDSPDYARLIATAKAHAETGEYEDWEAVRHRMVFDGDHGASALFERLMIQSDIDVICKKARA